ncbi:hypothetical protein TNCV_3549101 [Trichonephila clavipes]|nr:hypothetical protein TNCV_3549101 [Trichonephila clavipes]
MDFESLITFRWMSEVTSNLFPFKASLSRGNRKKSGGLRSGDRFGFGASDDRMLVRKKPDDLLQPTCLQLRHTGAALGVMEREQFPKTVGSFLGLFHSP